MLRPESEWQWGRQYCRFHGRQLRCPQAETSAEGNLFCSGRQRYRLFLNLGIFARKALMSFSNGSSAGLDGISPHILKDLTAKSNGQTGLNFLRALTLPPNLVNVTLEGKYLSNFDRTFLVQN